MTVVLIASLRHQLLGSIDFNIPSTSIGKGLRNNSKGKKNPQKDVVTKDVRSFFGGSTIVTSSDPLN